MTNIALTIGNFDGVHVGHQRVLRQLKKNADKALVFTFSNHPSEVLSTPKSLLSTLTHKLYLIKAQGVEIITIPFTKEFSEQSAETFLTKLKKELNFSHLILGHDAVIGCNREGTPARLEQLGHKLNFQLEYVQAASWEEETISSSQIRKVIEAGDFVSALPLLGRPYSIQGEVIKGAGRGKEVGFPTANIDVSMLCLPPFGVYSISVDGQLGIANLGLAPTLHAERTPHLEVHLFDTDRDLYGKTLDVMFLKFIRPEKKFDSVEELKKQIMQDIGREVQT